LALTGIFLSCAKESDLYFTPLGADAIEFAKNMGAVQTWYDQFNDTITSLAEGERLERIGAAQHYTIDTRYFFDSLYFRAVAYPLSSGTDIFGGRTDLVRIRFMEKLGSNDLLSSYIQIFPQLKDTVWTDGSQSQFVTDSTDWNGLTLDRHFILSSPLSDFEMVCDTTGALIAFKTSNARLYQLVNP
jgi:hypothetical protein